MRMSTCLSASGCLLLVACASPTPSVGAEPPPCTASVPPVGVTQVRVVIASDGSARPALCTVRSGTEVIWELRGAPFMLKFKAVPGHAAQGWARGDARRFTVDDPNLQFPSSPVGADQEVRLITKDVMVEESIGYCVALSTSCPDPGIKIVPR